MLEATTIKELVLFRIQDVFCGVDIDHVREINRRIDITHVPRSPGYVRGVMNLRGSIVTLIDLRKKFLFSTSELNTNMRVIIVTFHQESVGLLVDEVHDVIEVHSELMEPNSASIKGVSDSYFQATYKMEHHLVPILNINEILSVSNAQHA